MLLDLVKKDLKVGFKELQQKGYDHFIVEPYTKHEQKDERYITLSYDKYHFYLSYSLMGGVDIEDNSESVHTVRVDEKTKWSELANETGFKENQLQKLFETFVREHFTLLEINPIYRDRRRDSYDGCGDFVRYT